MLKIRIVLGSSYNGVINGWVYRYINIIKGLSTFSDCTVYIPGSGDKLQKDLPGVTVKAFKKAKRINAPYSHVKFIKSFIKPDKTQIFLPLFKYYPGYQDFINDPQNAPDITIYFGHDSLIHYGQNDSSPLVFCDFCDSMIRGLRNQIKQKKRNELLGAAELLYIKRIKKAFVPKKVKILAITDEDGASIKSALPDNTIITIPNGINEPESKAEIDSKYDSKNIIFVGSLNYMPNINSINYIIENIWPSVSAKYDKVKLLLVGRDPVPEIENMKKKDNRIEVIANVESVFPYLQSSKVTLCPMFLGGGLKNKILESLASGTPVVTNKEGATGIPMVHKEHGWIVESKEDMIGAIEEVFNLDLHNYKKMCLKCTQLAASFTWNSVTEKLKTQIHSQLTTT